MNLTDSPGARLRAIDDLRSSAGRLEAILNEPDASRGHAQPTYSVLLCHPHPLGGGTMHNKVVYRATKVFQSLGLPALRFNFRGTGLSEGKHDGGSGEVEDVRAALDWLEQEFHRPILFLGFSFGASVGLRACCGDPRVKGLVALGLPIVAEGREYHYPFLSACRAPKLFLSGAQDEYGPRAAVQAVAAAAASPTETVFIEGAGHFFTGKLEAMEHALRRWLEKRLSEDESQ